MESYLTDKLHALPDEAEVAVGVIQRNICSGCGMHEIFNVLIDLEILPENDKQLNEVIALINDMWNHTRMILNRGFTPNEIAEATRKSVGAKIIPFNQVKTNKNKIYPNDPCPCGSGKKYKNCCKNKK
ncbi:MAG: SEC-C metal-binding domain-containing protein [Lachnoclostridium sp.]